MTQRLFVVVAVAVLPTLAILALNLVTLRTDAERRLRDEAHASAKIATLELNRIIGGIQSVLRAVSNAPVVRSGNVEACHEYLVRVTEAAPEISDMAIADSAGNVVCRSASSVQTPISVADRDYFQSVKARDGAVTGTYSIGRVSGRATLPVAMPLAEGGIWPGGVIAAGLDLDWLGSRLKERDFLQQNALSIADRNGRIIAREPLPEKFVGTMIPDAFLHLVTAPEPGTMPVMSQDGTRRVIGYFPASEETLGLYVSAGVSTDVVYATTTRLMIQGSLVALIGIGAAFVLAMFTSNYFVRRPFRRLIKTIEAWQHEEFETRTEMGGDLGEFGRAGRALDTFMDQLEAARAERREAQRQREVLANELDHRIKNIIATVQAVARQTFRAKGLDATVRIFNDRLHAMASAHTALMKDAWQSAPILTVVEGTVAPFDDPQLDRFRLDGPDLQLGAKATMSLSMALHELCTNAAKYGALSVPSGAVQIDWRVDGSGPSPQFELMWTERGGPAVLVPSSRGFGSTMIEQMLAHQLGGSVTVEYAPGGLRCKVVAPLQNLEARVAQAASETGVPDALPA